MKYTFTSMRDYNHNMNPTKQLYLFKYTIDCQRLNKPIGILFKHFFYE